ncbi:hypothetical protein [Limnovirga soli]|uniref:Uncharacterized protein n=1 Tax=Limnovirga soli TaxID=2656915 RepID=A0A8J8FD99_9BACT|nr:hypothetical protein [Limnovirga soli]NNV54562.1 hypothetical protein [Limnovirga soli]
MKLKLTYNEFMCLYNILKQGSSFTRDYGGDMYHLLLQSCLVSLHQKFYKKAFLKEKTYSIKMEAHEALAFWLSYADHELDHFSFEGNLLQSVLNNIHKQFQLQ